MVSIQKNGQKNGLRNGKISSNKLKLIKAAVIVLFFSSTASLYSSTLRINALGGLTVPFTKSSALPSGVTLLPNPSYSFGAIFTIDALPFIKFDTGAIYSRTTFTWDQSSGSDKFQFHHLFVPLMARLEFWYLSVGFGGFFTFGLGDSIDHVRTISGKQTTYTKTYAQSNLYKNNFGLIVSVGARYKLPKLPLGFLFDVMYRFGLDELARPGSTSKSVKQSNLEILAGVSLYL